MLDSKLCEGWDLITNAGNVPDTLLVYLFFDQGLEGMPGGVQGG